MTKKQLTDLDHASSILAQAYENGLTGPMMQAAIRKAITLIDQTIKNDAERQLAERGEK